MFDPTPAELEGLVPELQAIAFEVIAVLRNLGYPAGITVQGGRRNEAEQRKLLAAGRTRTLHSAHLEGRAFDLDLLGYSRDRVPDWFWNLVGPWVEQKFDLVWGGRWAGFRDVGHFELPPG